MIDSNYTDDKRIVNVAEAFSREELAWFSEFESDAELWGAVDTLFPDPKTVA